MQGTEAKRMSRTSPSKKTHQKSGFVWSKKNGQMYTTAINRPKKHTEVSLISTFSYITTFN